MKTAIVTGSTKGIGLAISTALLGRGYFVFMNYANDSENAEAVKSKLSREYPGKFAVIHQPLETKEDVRRFHDEFTGHDEAGSGVDLLVLNAGCTDRAKWTELTWEKFSHVMDVNVNAPAELIRKFDGNLNNGGNIIMISSAMSVYPHAVSVPYTVSKSAVNGLTLALVKEYCGRNIRVNAILPGFVNTPWQKAKPEEQRQRICGKVALHRFAEPEEIAQAVMAIIDAGYINGALIPVDGSYCYS
ncbi:MAG: SDR family oxidoreductase [Synergistaceae bacterium]|nr:SDR family oxidoreductase [Synergistaceae bacterium]